MKPLLVWLSAVVIRLIGSSLRYTIDDRAGILDRPEHTPIIFAFWHNRTALMAYLCQRHTAGRKNLTFISRSRDGQFMTDVAAKFGIHAVRGSSSRHGGAAMLTAVRAASDSNTDLVITPDGPRGPCYEVQPGVLRLAQGTGRPVVPITYHLDWKIELKSWDRFQVPIPFSRCRVITEAMVYVSENASDEEFELLRNRVKSNLGGD